jgi:NAD(P)H-flavin reductase
VSVKVNDEGMRRSYSVASLPGKDYIDILIDVSPMGLGSKYFLGLNVGDEVEILGFLGKFNVATELSAEDQLLFIATGTGLAPVRPMIEEVLTGRKFMGKVILVWGMRKETDLYWVEEMERLKRDYENFDFELVLSQSTEEWPGNKGHVGDVVEKMELNWPKVKAYLCGAPEMIEDMNKRLSGFGVPNEGIVFERYS